MADKPNSYCAYVQTLTPDNLHRIYHDTQYGFPIQSDDELFERLVLEINQAGLSWNTILQKQKNFQKAVFCKLDEGETSLQCGGTLYFLYPINYC